MIELRSICATSPGVDDGVHDAFVVVETDAHPCGEQQRHRERALDGDSAQGRSSEPSPDVSSA
ncbi:MAG: hypothetical protein IPN32_04525 [Deltaproteobacteria bacterium]|nr:hypothetical protein [Deltaproteobacteria bacterium]